MMYYSTNKQTPDVTLKEAVVKGLAADKGLFMPRRIEKINPEVFDRIHEMTFQEIACEVAVKFFGDDVDAISLKNIVYDTLQFDCPLVNVHDNIYALELFHGPTLAFKDVGARFMARLLNYFLSTREKQVNVLVATSGDTGSAVANGFLNVEGIKVHVLYPKGKVSLIQESQFTTLGNNITALEIDGTFDDCQRLVKTAFMDEDLNRTLVLTSANSINVARFLPQAFYYFHAFAQFKTLDPNKTSNLVISVPSGNFGNLTAGLIAREMGLPVDTYLAANNANDVFLEYLNTGKYNPRMSVETIANAMDVGAPSNFDRILDLYDHSHAKISSIIKGFRYTDSEIRETLRKVYFEYGYLCDPHGACGYQALMDYMEKGQTGIFLETAHPVKFRENMGRIINQEVNIPPKLAEFMKGNKEKISLTREYKEFKSYLGNKL